MGLQVPQGRVTLGVAGTLKAQPVLAVGAVVLEPSGVMVILLLAATGVQVFLHLLLGLLFSGLAGAAGV
jgi:hypothetical protein